MPVGEWLIRKGATLGPLVARQAGVADLCRPDAVGEDIRQQSAPRRVCGLGSAVLRALAPLSRGRGRGDGDIFDLLGAG